jgi:hypothetical protein
MSNPALGTSECKPNWLFTKQACTGKYTSIIRYTVFSFFITLFYSLSSAFYLSFAFYVYIASESFQSIRITLAHLKNFHVPLVYPPSSTLKTEADYSSEMSAASCKNVRRHISEDSHLHPSVKVKGKVVPVLN